MLPCSNGQLKIPSGRMNVFYEKRITKKPTAASRICSKNFRAILSRSSPSLAIRNHQGAHSLSELPGPEPLGSNTLGSLPKARQYLRTTEKLIPQLLSTKQNKEIQDLCREVKQLIALRIWQEAHPPESKINDQTSSFIKVKLKSTTPASSPNLHRVMK